MDTNVIIYFVTVFPVGLAALAAAAWYDYRYVGTYSTKKDTDA